MIDNNLITDIPNYNFIKAEPVNKGLSGDKKFRVETADGRVFLLRISDIEKLENKKAMFEMMQRVSALDLPMSRPIAFGLCGGGNNVYQLLSWCEGKTVDSLLPALTEGEQYSLGIKAGKNLKLIHLIPSPEGIDNWHDCYAQINDERIKSFTGCGVNLEGSEAIINYYEENRHLLKSRLQTFIHSDFHNENLMVSDDFNVSVIDWELLDTLYGDPWSELECISASENFYPHFAAGLLHGYFEGKPPEEFWRVLALYLSVSALTRISWAVYVEPQCLDESVKIADYVLRWFDGMKNPVPSWYLKDFT